VSAVGKTASAAKVMIAIPAYNCAAQVPRVIRQLDEQTGPLFAEVVVIDNQSTDHTCEAALAAASVNIHVPVTVMRNTENYSLGGTHKVAFARCIERGYDGVVILHGDDQGRISDFADIVEESKRTQADCILGARFMPGASLTGYNSFRVFGNHLFNLLYTVVVRKRVYDMGSGLNFYDRKLIEKDIHTKMPDDLTFNNCMLLATYAAGCKVVYKPISWREEDQVSNARLFKQATKLLRYLTLYVFNRSSLLNDDFRSVRRDCYPSERQGGNKLSEDFQ
jgi:glycosyltransferase involved in cell wall biosynthesis